MSISAVGMSNPSKYVSSGKSAASGRFSRLNSGLAIGSSQACQALALSQR